jgi:hypothetical protein
MKLQPSDGSRQSELCPSPHERVLIGVSDSVLA